MNSNKKFDLKTLLDIYAPSISLPFHVSLQSSKRKYDRDGHWNQKQRVKYAIFISHFRSLLEDPQKIRSIRIYEMMSDMIITRNPNQCRSHHQKMEKYRLTIPQIIASVSQRYEPNLYRQLTEKYQVLIKTLLQNQDRYIRLIPLQEKHQKSRINVGMTFAQVERPKKVEIKNLDLINMEDEVKNMKDDKVKTSDSYEQDKMDYDEEQDHQAIPQMRLDDPKLQEEQLPKFSLNTQNLQSYQLIDFGFNGGFQHFSDRVSYFTQQLKILELKKQWHEHNIKQFSQQIKNEQEAINLCQKTICFCLKSISPITHYY